MQYPKIQTLFKRDEKNIIIPDDYTLDEFKELRNMQWECTEKIDGTNIRIFVECDGKGNVDVRFGGRTDNAQIPGHLLERLNQLFNKENLAQAFYIESDMGLDIEQTIILYGEGYGTKIQKGGNYIKDGVDFILFDVKVGKWWLQRKAIEEVATALGISPVPIIGYMTIPEAIKVVAEGFKSTISENKEYEAEGLVLKNPYGMLLRNGDRLITKLKTTDFRKWEAANVRKA